MSQDTQEEKELQLEELTEEHRTKLIEHLHELEEEHKVKFPEDIYEIYVEVEKYEILFSKKFEYHVKRMYASLLEKLKDKKLAGIITHDLLDPYRTASTVRKHLPDDSKDERKQKNMREINKRQANTNRIDNLIKGGKPQTGEKPLTTISTTQGPAKKEVKEVWVKYPQTGIVARTISKLQEQREEDIRVKVDLVDLVIIDAQTAKELVIQYYSSIR